MMGNNPSYFSPNNGYAEDLSRPVEQVTWQDATNYCGRLTVLERTAGRLPAGYVYRLPTEAEWEYACRAGTTTRFSFGDDFSYSLLGNFAWYGSNSGDQTHPVGQKLPNPWGLYDVYGNVYEWCLDWYGPYPGGSVTDPRGVGSGSYRVRRGGAWHSPAAFCRSALRDWPDHKYYGHGFRPVLAPSP